MDVLFKFVREQTVPEQCNGEVLTFDPYTFFPVHPSLDTLVLKMTAEGLYSSSRRQGAKKLSEMLKRFCKHDPKTIVDGTAGIGTDALTLALTFRHATVYAIENNPLTYAALYQNSRCYNFPNLKVVKTDIMHFLNTTSEHIDILYIDAPWGGKEYKKNTCMNVYINKKLALSDIVKHYHVMFKNCIIVFKVPINFCFDEFEHSVVHDTCLGVHKVPYKCRNVIKFWFYVCQ